MNNILLGPVVGAVDQKKAKIWFYGTVDQEGKIPFCHVFDQNKATPIAGSPFEFKAVSSSAFKLEVEPQKAYAAEVLFPKEGEAFSYGIHYGPGDIDRGELKYAVRPFPEEGDKNFSFGLISCHKPRKKKLKRIPNMWGFLYEKMAERNARFLVQAGDQVYCDSDKYTINAWKRSMDFIKDKENISEVDHRQMLDFYRLVYIGGWLFPDVNKVLSEFPQVMIWDDHEITDGWGSRKEHFHMREQAVFKAAKEVYYEFQHSHNPDPLRQGEMYYAFHYGAAAFLVLDLRGERNIVQKQLISSTQWQEIENWLNSDKVKASKILFVISSVPVVHLSRELLSLSGLVTLFLPDVKDDVRDQWSYKHNKEARRKLLKLLMAWSGEKNKPVFILGGDVHVGTEACLRKENSDKRFYQITSSPITNNRALLLDVVSAPISSRFRFRLDEDRKEYMKARIVRRYRRRNFAIIDVKYENGHPKVTLNMYREGKKKPKTSELLDECSEKL